MLAALLRLVKEPEMNQLVPIIADRVPALIAAGGEKTTYRFFEFFRAKPSGANHSRA
jgi:hypothetical protein